MIVKGAQGAELLGFNKSPETYIYISPYIASPDALFTALTNENKRISS